MALWYAIVENGIVSNVVEWSDEENPPQTEGWIKLNSPTDCWLGFIYDGKNFIDPNPMTQLKSYQSDLMYLNADYSYFSSQLAASYSLCLFQGNDEILESIKTERDALKSEYSEKLLALKTKYGVKK